MPRARNDPRFNAPSAIKLFPHIGMINDKETYTTTRNVELRDIEKAPNGIDSFNPKGYYNSRNNPLKDYKNSHIVTKDMLLNRKFKKATKGV